MKISGTEGTAKDFIMIIAFLGGLIIVFYVLAKREIGNVAEGVVQTLSDAPTIVYEEMSKLPSYIAESNAKTTIAVMESQTGMTLTDVMREATGDASYEEIPTTISSSAQLAIAGMQASSNLSNIDYIYLQLSQADRDTAEVKAAYLKALSDAEAMQSTAVSGISTLGNLKYDPYLGWLFGGK